MAAFLSSQPRDVLRLMSTYLPSADQVSLLRTSGSLAVTPQVYSGVCDATQIEAVQISKWICPRMRVHTRAQLRFLRAATLTLVISSSYREELEPGDLPATVTRLIFEGSWTLKQGLLPTGLKVLLTGYLFNQPLTPGLLPDGLEELVLGDRYNHPLSLDALPLSLRELHVGASYQSRLEVPNTLRTLHCRAQLQPDGPNFSLAYEEGCSLQTAVFYQYPEVIGPLPVSLTSLRFETGPATSRFDLPALRTLNFGYEFNTPLAEGDLPTSLQTLSFRDLYSFPIPAGVLPRGLKRLLLSKYQPLQDWRVPVGTTVWVGSRRIPVEAEEGDADGYGRIEY